MRRLVAWVAGAGVAAASLACDRAEPRSRPDPTAEAAAREPAGPRATASVAPATPRPSLREAIAMPQNDAGEPASDAGDESATASADAGSELDAAAHTLVRPPLTAADGSLLPQTRDEPSAQSAWFQAGVAALFRAIQADDPSIAEPFFFPLEAYQLVKDVKKPERDWKLRLMAHFRRDVHDYHAKLGKRAAEARLLDVDLATKNVRWMKPGSEGNKLGYYRVTRSRLRYELDGTQRSLELTSFISWRGEWYLVHLNGFD